VAKTLLMDLKLSYVLPVSILPLEPKRLNSHDNISRPVSSLDDTNGILLDRVK